MNILKYTAKKDLKIQYDQAGKNHLDEIVNVCVNKLHEAKEELKRNKIKVKNLEELSDGNFVEIQDQYLKAEFEKSTAAKEFKLSFKDFKEKRKIDTSNLEELQTYYIQSINSVQQLYDFNNSFFKYCDSTLHSKDPFRKKLFSKAPKKRDYRTGDMFTITGNKVKINTPDKPFEMYLLNKKQKELMLSIEKFIEASKELNLELKFIHSAIDKYLSKDCDYQLKDVVFKYNEILKHNL